MHFLQLRAFRISILRISKIALSLGEAAGIPISMSMHISMFDNLSFPRWTPRSVWSFIFP